MNKKEVLKIDNPIEILNSLNAIKELKKLGAEIFLVGGIVRDNLINKSSKDIDIIVRLVKEEDIVRVLKNNGTLASDDDDGKTGESFGVFKFFPNEIELEEAIDIALPRTESLMSDEEFSEAVENGDLKLNDHHKAFVVDSDHLLSIEEDLRRRDITINSIAINIDTDEVIDPFGGVNDLENKIIKATSTESFKDDPLRMLRVCQFASRFDFSIDKHTFDMIVSNKKDINHISKERVLLEFDKIFNKGDIGIGIESLEKTGLMEELCPEFDNNSKDFINFVETRADFFSLFCKNGKDFIKNFKGDVNVANSLNAFANLRSGIISIIRENNIIDNNELSNHPFECRLLVFESLKLSNDILNSGIIKSNDVVFKFINEFKNGIMPKTSKELAINGFDFINKGFKGIEIGEKQKEILELIFKEKVKNNKEDLLNIL